ncbi:MAG TPA: hypothetical protein VMG37_12070 [Solirubrobacteraceae bacterium]|nr:hypothetical protein [Solirubrobacteraceae bacterium]
MRRAFLAYRGGMFLDPRHRLQIAATHADALRQIGAHSRTPSPSSLRGGAVSDLAIVIRPNRRDDERALARLAGLDCAPVPAEPLLVAEVGGELRAALSLRDNAVIADPFHFTAQLVTLLRMRAEQLVAERSGSGRWFARARARLAPAR